jgi:hypothetical protein
LAQNREYFIRKATEQAAEYQSKPKNVADLRKE